MSSEPEVCPVPFRVSEGDWTCSDCANINFARRTSCNRCNKEKGQSSKKRKLGHEIGKAAAEKSRGLFSADDWQCNKCGNVNWARRQQCNVCNAPKFGEVEERTGFGGGYNDRGVVEYKERNDSDDEYDEFGRRKKRGRRNDDSSDDDDDGGPQQPAVPVQQQQQQQQQHEVEKRKPATMPAATVDNKRPPAYNNTQEEEDEEEEEDDDDDDLSKYDLTDIVDEANTNSRSPH